MTDKVKFQVYYKNNKGLKMVYAILPDGSKGFVSAVRGKRIQPVEYVNRGVAMRWGGAAIEALGQRAYVEPIPQPVKLADRKVARQQRQGRGGAAKRNAIETAKAKARAEKEANALAAAELAALEKAATLAVAHMLAGLGAVNTPKQGKKTRRQRRESEQAARRLMVLTENGFIPLAMVNGKSSKGKSIYAQQAANNVAQQDRRVYTGAL